VAPKAALEPVSAQRGGFNAVVAAWARTTRKIASINIDGQRQS
jgi:hypothetical protein